MGQMACRGVQSSFTWSSSKALPGKVWVFRTNCRQERNLEKNSQSNASNLPHPQPNFSNWLFFLGYVPDPKVIFVWCWDCLLSGWAERTHLRRASVSGHRSCPFNLHASKMSRWSWTDFWFFKTRLLWVDETRKQSFLKMKWSTIQFWCGWNRVVKVAIFLIIIFCTMLQ